ncbi:ubiquinone/menaquinone biosynthesis methyltransferase [Thermodesulfobacteriota bacterium]
MESSEERIRNRPLHNMFTSLPPRYDLINRIITLGFDKRWRREAAKACLVSRPARVVDLCCGTGDLALDFRKLGGNDLEIIGLDFSGSMLKKAAQKAASSAGRISFVHGEVGSLPFRSRCFDCVGISFAFRNLTHNNPMAQKHLAEIFRILREDGRLVIVESSQPRAKLTRELYHLFLHIFAAQMGAIIARNRAAYRYLAQSAIRFYDPLQLTELLKDTGFRQVSFRPLFLGATCIHEAIR